MLLKSLLQVASPAGARARLSILIFHRVLPQPDPIFPNEMHASRFDQTCGWLKSWFNVLPLDNAVSRLQTGTLPARPACITFDDGYADNFDVALPILKAHGLPATFFIATGFLNGGRMWNDTVVEAVRLTKASALVLPGFGCFPVDTIEEKSDAIHAVIGKIKYLPSALRLVIAEGIAADAGVDPPDNLMLTSTHIREMHKAGMQIGAHTVSHPILAGLTVAEVVAEIEGSKRYLEGLTGERISLFAYPNGKHGEDYTAKTVEVVRGLGFDAAVTTECGTSNMRSDLFQIRRFSPWDRTRLRFAARMLSNLRHNHSPT